MFAVAQVQIWSLFPLVVTPFVTSRHYIKNVSFHCIAQRKGKGTLSPKICSVPALPAPLGTVHCALAEVQSPRTTAAPSALLTADRHLIREGSGKCVRE